jgi:hypothetical protein
MFSAALYARVRTFRAHCTRDRGCSAHPAFPAPSVFERARISSIARAHRAARSRRCVCVSKTRHPEVRALRRTCAAGRASKDESATDGPSSFEARKRAPQDDGFENRRLGCLKCKYATCGAYAKRSFPYIHSGSRVGICAVSFSDDKTMMVSVRSTPATDLITLASRPSSMRVFFTRTFSM